MDPCRFDDVLRTLPHGSRRALLAALAGVFIAQRSAHDATARKRKKRKPLPFNTFGCIDIGNVCRGSDANCCSGVCDGNKPKNGKRDTSRCIAHDASTCIAGQAPADCGGTGEVKCVTSALRAGQCFTTTGNAPYCAAGGSGQCFPCKKDADCVAVCGAQASCVTCADCAVEGGTACAGIGNCNFPP